MLIGLGYAAALLMGAVLGLMGGGGSILTVPILSYLFALPATQATAYSLFIVGLTSLVGVLASARQGLIDYRKGIAFALPATLGVFLARRWVIPALPEVLLRWGGLSLSRDAALLLLFAGMMLLAAVAMLRPASPTPRAESEKPPAAALMVITGLGLGLVTGLMGAGGGFLIVPALVALARLEIRAAMATSLLVIAINSLVGFGGELRPGHSIDWGFLVGFSSLTIVGVLVGGRLAGRIPAQRLKPAFGIFVLAMGLLILLKEASGLR